MHFGWEGSMPIYMRYTRSNGLRVRGGVAAKSYEGWIELQSMQINQPREPVDGAAKAASAPPPPSITITKQQDGASNELYGEVIRNGVGTAQIDFTKTAKGKPVAHMSLVLEGEGDYRVHGAAAPVVPNRSQWGGMWDMGRGA